MLRPGGTTMTTESTTPKTVNAWEAARVIANWIAAILIPLVLGASVYLITLSIESQSKESNKAIKQQEFQSRMIELAVNVLTSKPDVQGSDWEIRKWARDVINDPATVPKLPEQVLVAAIPSGSSRSVGEVAGELIEATDFHLIKDPHFESTCKNIIDGMNRIWQSDRIASFTVADYESAMRDVICSAPGKSGNTMRQKWLCTYGDVITSLQSRYRLNPTKTADWDTTLILFTVMMQRLVHGDMEWRKHFAPTPP